MRRVPTSRQLAAGTVAASLCSLPVILVASRMHTQPDPDGTSLAGLAYAMLLALGLLSLGSGGLLAVHTRCSPEHGHGTSYTPALEQAPWLQWW